MKTNGITYASAKRCIASSIFSLIITIPAFSQVDVASQKGSSFSGMEKTYTTSIKDYYALSGSFNARPGVFLSDLLTTSLAHNVKAKTAIIDDDKKRINEKIPTDEKYHAADIESADISFKPKAFTYPENSRTDIGITQYSADQLLLYAKVLKQFARKNGYDTNYAFFSNMGMRSNRKRFFVINLATMQIEQSGLVAHGRGQGPSVFDKQYSNQEGSKCTSLGRYKIYGKYKGGYGEAYKMAGLDSSNKNAYNRNIVLHAMGCIPDKDGVMPACVSEGCPAVSTQFLSSLGKIIDSRKKPVLLWIFDSNLEEAVVEDRAAKSKAEAERFFNKHHSCAIHVYRHDDQDIQ
jgi:L,D-transpeptidase catalytic domain